jgi:UDP-N-acetylmuramyl tripeptide synthase
MKIGSNNKRNGSRNSASEFKKSSLLQTGNKLKTACQLAQPNDIILIAGKGMKPIKKLMQSS